MKPPPRTFSPTYALSISPTLTVFRGTPTLRVDRTQPPPRLRPCGARSGTPAGRNPTEIACSW